jgi:hypothetical protein
MLRNMLAGLALVTAVGFTVLAPTDAHARRRCCNGNGYYGRSYQQTGTTYAAPSSPCSGQVAPTNPDGSIAPQPSDAPAPATAAPPPPAPAPAPPSASTNLRRTRPYVISARM